MVEVIDFFEIIEGMEVEMDEKFVRFLYIYLRFGYSCVFFIILKL